MTDQTDRHALPLLAVAQAQKEITHNEAITRLTLLAHPAAESAVLTTPPASPSPGQMWIVAPAATGAWAGQDQALALWTASGWRFQPATAGMLCWNKADNRFLAFASGNWTAQLPTGGVAVGGQAVVGTRQSAIANPSGGTTVDAEARTALAVILTALRTHGLIAT